MMFCLNGRSVTDKAQAKMRMPDPASPSELLVGWLEDLNMSVTAFSQHIGISRGVMLSRVVHGHSAISGYRLAFA